MNNDLPSILLDFRNDRIRVNKATLNTLGNPTNIMLLVNPEAGCICIKAGDPDDPTTHRIASQRQPGNVYYELHSKHLMGILLQCSDWDPMKNYRLAGRVMGKEQEIKVLYDFKGSVCVTVDDAKQKTEAERKQ